MLASTRIIGIPGASRCQTKRNEDDYETEAEKTLDKLLYLSQYIRSRSFLGTRSHDVVENTITAETVQLESHDVYESRDVRSFRQDVIDGERLKERPKAKNQRSRAKR
jgi:hypothetical protein